MAAWGRRYRETGTEKQGERHERDAETGREKARDAQRQKDVEMERDPRGPSSWGGWERAASRDREGQRRRQTEVERQR